MPRTASAFHRLGSTAPDMSRSPSEPCELVLTRLPPARARHQGATRRSGVRIAAPRKCERPGRIRAAGRAPSPCRYFSVASRSRRPRWAEGKFRSLIRTRSADIRCRLSLPQVCRYRLQMSAPTARPGIPERCESRGNRPSGGCRGRPRGPSSDRGDCGLSDHPMTDGSQGSGAKRRRNGRRKRRAAAGAGLVPPVIRVEIQNLEQLGRESDGASEERAARLAAAEAQVEERAVRVAALEAELAERERRVAERETELEPLAGLLDSRERLDRRERQVTELEEELRERRREVEERENELDARRAVVEADLDLREAEVERREDSLAIREERLEQRQRELGVYVSQLQSRLEPSEPRWASALGA